MSKNPHTSCYKNLICISVGLLIIFTTSIFVAKDYFGYKIKNLIDQATLLKDYHYSYWGQFPGNIQADYNYKITLYNYSKDSIINAASQRLQPITFKHTFHYKNVSFGQGNQGFIKYLHNWELTPIQQIPKTTFTTFNLGAEKVYGYERIATDSRKFTIMYNALWESVKGMLIKFYSSQLHQFYFKNQEIVYDVVFSEIGIDDATMNAIYNDQQYGMKNVETFEFWVKLCNQKDKTTLVEYELIRQKFGLSIEILDRLIGEHSMMHTLSTVLNGTVKLILQNPKGINYKGCVPFCSDDQMIGYEILSGGMTNSQGFVNINMRKTIKQLNQTIYDDVQLTTFCPECMVDDNYINFFANKHFGNYTIMSNIFANIDNFEYIQSLVELPDESYAQHIVDYIKYLQQNVFNPINPDTEQIDRQAFGYMINNYIYINKVINDLKNLLHIELHSRAFINLIQKQKIICQDFFTGNYQSYSKLCNQDNLSFTTLNGAKTYIKAYFFMERNVFSNITGMNDTQQVIQFLRLDQNSLFVNKINQLRNIFKEHYGCQRFCTPQDLLIMEWSGQNSILQNLPTDLFINPPKSILQWDSQNLFQGIQPQYHKIMGQKLSTQQGRLLLGSGKQSILVLSNLLALKTYVDNNEDKSAKKIINYISKIVIDIYFGGPISSKPLPKMLQGFSSFGIQIKNKANQLMGGASWISPQVRLLQTHNKPQTFNKVNTGIYDKNQLRSMLQFNHYSTLGSEYTVYETQFGSLREFLTSGRAVYGTNLLGFHADIGKTESLSAFLDFAYQGVILTPQDSSYKFLGVDAIKYSIQNSQMKTYLGIDLQNERSVLINQQSYFIVDPITGNTLQFFVKYSISSKNSFLNYYYLDSAKEIPLYQTQVFYSRNDVSSINQIASVKQSLRTIYIITIVFASISMISVVLFTLIYRIKLKKKEGEFNQTLITSETGSLKI